MDRSAQRFEQAQMAGIADRRALRVNLDHETQAKRRTVHRQLVDPWRRVLQSLRPTHARLAQACSLRDVALAQPRGTPGIEQLPADTHSQVRGLPDASMPHPFDARHVPIVAACAARDLHRHFALTCRVP
jgi:hypothetical protein